MHRKPDFICIGPTKTATDWLHSLLIQFPAVDIPVKEVYFFWGLEEETSAQLNYRNIIRNVLHVQRKMYMQGFSKKYSHLSWDTLRHLRWDVNFFFSKRSPKWYAHLYQEGKISGDMNAMLYLLQEEQIRKMREHLPDLRIIIHLRDPVERVWSNINMVINFSGQKYEREYYTLTHLRNTIDWNVHSLPSYVDFIKRWKACFPEEQIQITYFDEIAMHPEIVLARTAAFLGLHMSDFTGSEHDISTPVHVTVKTEMPEDIRRYLVRGFYRDVEKLSMITSSPYPAQWLIRYLPYFSATDADTVL